MRWCPAVNSNLEILPAPRLDVRYETVVRVSRAIGAHLNAKELFRILMDELRGVVQFDFVGISFRDQDSDAFQNYFIDMTSRSELVPEEHLPPQATLTPRVYNRQQPPLSPTSQMD